MSETDLIAVTFQFKQEFETHELRAVTFDRMVSPFYEGEKWAVRRTGSVLSKDLEWEYEPMPSNRDDEFYKRCRFDSLKSAIEAYHVSTTLATA